MLSLWLALLVLVTFARDCSLRFFLSFVLLAPLPVIFIPFRGFFVMYLPLAGWAMFVARLFVSGRNALWSRVWKRPPLSNNPFEPERLFLFFIVGFLVAWIPMHDVKSERVSKDPGQIVIPAMRDDILRLREPLPRGARVLFLHDRFPANAWGTVMICRLLYRDRDLWADRPTMMKTAPDYQSYDRVFDYMDHALTVIKRTSSQNRGPLLLPKER